MNNDRNKQKPKPSTKPPTKGKSSRKAKNTQKKVRELSNQIVGLKRHETKSKDSAHGMDFIARAGATYGLGAVDFWSWSKLLSKPFTSQLVKCPVNFNPVPSVSTFCASTVSTFDLPVDAGVSREVIFFPGHSDESTSDPMDGEAYHSKRQQFINGGFTVGPVEATGSGYGTCIAVSGNLVMNQLPSASTAIGYTSILWDNPLPMTANYTAGHLRWKCIAIGIRWKNCSPALKKGGIVRSVQPSIAYVPAVSPGGPGWAGYDRFKTYREYKTLDGEMSWIPRIEDLSFWHVTNSTGTSSDNAGVRLLFTSPTGEGNDQQYQLEALYCWELSGSSVQALSTSAVHTSSLRNPTEDGITAMANSQSTADKAAEIFGTAVNVASKITNMIAKHGS